MRVFFREVDMFHYEVLTPEYIDLIFVLTKWKILRISDLYKLTEFKGTMTCFYKRIAKLEKHNLIESFIYPFTGEKFVYLSKNGSKVLDFENQIPIHSENRFHDAQLTKCLFELTRHEFVAEIYLDHEIKKKLPLIKHTPDALIKGFTLKQEFNIAIELELTQKSRDRVVDIFRFFDSSNIFNNILYLFNRKTTYESYQLFLDKDDRILNKKKFLFLYSADLTKKDFDLFKAEVTHFNNKTTLENLFSGRHNAPIH